MDIFFIVLAAAALFGLALLGASLGAIFVAWRQAKRSGLSVSFAEAQALTKFFDLEEEFLSACVQFKQIDPKVSVVDLVRHCMADGDTHKLLVHWKQLKAAHVQITLKSLVLYDLAGKDMDQLILNLNREYVLMIPEINEHGLSAYYYCKFKISGDSSGWITPDIQSFKTTIKEKITLAMLTGDLSDFEALAHFIQEEYLNEKFWKKLCHGQIIDQQIRISKG
ncbi:hypothetical protein N7E81_00735 [Reichenbachiella carrageenanivorans]|uniref:Uncharacterized protein n=1 Tax=Reichenbachiella carrageenanivorans TaxID=2979869 RepID=A0ABY6D1Z1_9BACT|nr:hypothetical protein [Reichenbachiella carrageenanivorans]UXX79635.1 hypothetical protein N7E81_00735 [Reichenbachiella carrageenanivorans]